MSRQRYNQANPRGFSKARIRNIRRRYNLTGCIEIHHVIPREFSEHCILKKYGYLVEADYNTIPMPSFYTGGRRPAHNGGHVGYNSWVCVELDKCTSFTLFVLLITLLHRGSRGRVPVPWK